MRRVAYVLGLPVVLFAAWYVVSAGSENFYAPPLRDILESFAKTWTPGRLEADVLPSLLRLAAGYALAAAIGVALGLAIGLSPGLRATVEPVLEFFRAVPPPVLVPVIMLFAGIGDGMKIIVIVSGCVWPVLLNTVEGVRAVDSVQLDTARAYGVGGVARIRRVIVPAASPQIAAGLRQALSIAIILMVISEMFAAGNGLGFTIVQFQRSFAIPEMWSGIILLDCSVSGCRCCSGSPRRGRCGGTTACGPRRKDGDDARGVRAAQGLPVGPAPAFGGGAARPDLHRGDR